MAFLDNLAFVVGNVQGIKVNVVTTFIRLAVHTKYTYTKPFLVTGASSSICYHAFLAAVLNSTKRFAPSSWYT